MIKYIKRAGICFFAIAIICLMVVGCLCATQLNELRGKDSLFSLDSNVNDINKQDNTADIPAISEEVLIEGGSCAELSAKWTQAVEKALTGKHILATLTANWTANSANGFWAEGTGFINQIINVPTGAVITLDLNGFNIDRGIQNFQDNGGIIRIDGGTLIIKDSKYDSETMFSNYNSSYQGEICLAGYNARGVITGGRNSGSGGAITMYGGKLIMESGMIYNNRSTGYGGAIYAQGAEIVINDGVINNNTADGVSGVGGGGAIYLTSASKLDFYNGIIHKNSAIRLLADDGGGIVITGNAECNIYDGIFANNRAEDAGGFAVMRAGTLNVMGGKFEYNHAVNDGGAFYLPGGETNISNAYISNNSTSGYGGAFNFAITSNVSDFPNVTIKDTIIKNNTSVSHGGGITGGLKLNLGKNVHIYDNTNQGNPSDLELYYSAVTVNILENLEDSKIGIQFGSGHNGIFANNYKTYNENVLPYNYFYSNDYASIATNKDDAVTFEKTISGGKYDFVYLDNNKRVSYADKDLTHTVNDFELRKSVNGGKLVLGSITQNTSVNEFLQNLNFAENRIKLYDGANNLIYNYSNMQTGYNDLFDDSSMLAVGTGWKIEVYSTLDNLIEEIYLSVLGDLTGDGKVNSADINYLRRLINDKALYDGLADKPYLLLSALIVNKNGITSSDSNILWNVVCGSIEIEYFF